MGATYTRQSSSAIVDGGVIEASDLNAEFNQILAAFAVTSGHSHDGTTAEGGPITKLLGTAITIGDATAGTDIAVTFDGETSDGILTWMEDEDYFQFSDDLLLTTTEKLQFRDTAIYINSSADGQLDLVADTEIQIAATTIDINGAVDISGTLTLAGTTLAETISDTVGAMVSSNTETGITVSYEDGDNTLDFALGAAQTTITSLLATDIKIGEDDQTKIDFETADEIHFYAANVEQVYLGDNIFGPQSDSDVDLGSTGVRWKDAFIDTITTTGNVTVGGDLTVTGDDITMGTNTAGNILVADGTNFNSIAATSLSEISTIANDDVFLAVDTSGGGLKKVSRSTVVSGLATSGAISNVVEDSTPQLGGNLDLNGSDIVTTSNADLELAPNGTGHVTVRGNTNSGAIQFNCESNSHGQIVIAQPHSAGVTNTLTLPAGSSSTLVSLVSTDTLTNKTLTSAVLNTGVSGSAILDEDNMASNSATQLATQQSIKAYVDSQVATADTLAELSDTNISSPASGHVLVYDGSDSFDNVAVSGDITIAANGAVTIAATAVENSMLAGSIADSKLNTISTAGKVALTALEIDGGTDIGADLTTSDLIVVDDGAGGTNRKAALSRVVTLVSANIDDPTALAIALG